MAKQSIFGRIAQLAKANINALIDSAEDPGLMLDQMVRDYTNSIAEAESAVAQTIGNLRLMEQDHAEDLINAGDWGRKALAASNKADELRAAGNSADAAAHARPHAERDGPDQRTGVQGPGPERARLRRSHRPAKG